MCEDCESKKGSNQSNNQSNYKPCPKCGVAYNTPDYACVNCRHVDNVKLFLEGSGALI